MGADWPFTVKEGFVSCQKTDIGDALLFTSDGNTYSLNGTASTKNLAPEIRGSGLWASDPKIAGLKDIGAVFEKARSTCSP